jgi:hypothetical protein
LRTLHSFLAIGGGFLTLAVLVAISAFLTRRFAPSLADNTQPQLIYKLYNLATSAAFGMAGGYVTALIGRDNPLVYTLALALIVLLLSALAALQLKGTVPVAYQLTLTILTPLAVLSGGILRVKQLGIL